MYHSNSSSTLLVASKSLVIGAVWTKGQTLAADAWAWDTAQSGCVPAEGLPAVLGLPHQQLLLWHARLDLGIVLQVGLDAGIPVRHGVIPKLPQQPPPAYCLQVSRIWHQTAQRLIS